MSYSDYLYLKNKKNTTDNYPISASIHTQNKQLCNIQTTVLFNEDNEEIDVNRFHFQIKDICLNVIPSNKDLPMFSIPKIHVIEYVKNRYQPPFCWTCKTPIIDILDNLACSVCETMLDIKVCDTISDLDLNLNIDILNLDILDNIDYWNNKPIFELSNVSFE
jgi:hypothetical protein